MASLVSSGTLNRSLHIQLCAQLDAVLIAEDGGIVSLAIDGYQVRIRMAAQSLPCAAAWPAEL